MKGKKILFAAPAGDMAGETAISILCKQNYPTIIFRLEEAKETKEVLLVIFFTPENRKVLNNSNIKSASYLFLGERMLGKRMVEISYFLIACNPEKMKEESFSSAVINIAKKYQKWGEDKFSFSNKNSFPPWGQVPDNIAKKEIFRQWDQEMKCFWKDY